MSRHGATTTWRAVIGNAILPTGLALLSAALLLRYVDARGPQAAGWLGAALLLAAWLGLFGWWRLRRVPAPRKPLRVADTAAARDPAPTAAGAPVEAAQAVVDVQVVYASQTGFAEQLARQTLQSLQAAGVPAHLHGLDGVTPDELRRAGRVLFVASTTGDGEPPDMAQTFSRLAMRQPAPLGGLRYGLLALGDSDYEDFCGFGRQLQRWLEASGARALFDPVEVDSEDEASLRHWQHHLAMLTGVSDLPDWQAPKYQHWRLAERRLLNPGSVGEACFHLELQPLEGRADWQAGDLVEIGPCHAPEKVAAWLAASGLDGCVPVAFGRERLPLAGLLARCRLPEAGEIDGLDEAAVAAKLQRLPHREYSIASLPGDGAIHLLVRQMRGRGGYLGLGSGWLTAHAPIGASVALRVRSNPNFHLPRDARPLILIGNGTGLAALRALLKARIAAGHRRNWLLFGERHAAHDGFYREEIERWLAGGRIERADFAWSRDQAERIHVQQRLREAAGELRRWVDADAAIYVCGSLDGLAPGVDAVLRDVLGDAEVGQLRAQGRYRRDVY
ncbi:sulfite reductase subunit alpha [Rhodanobacter thiooxydans]|uniref:NADPH--hemoprotein reductase n=1 Tax=Rhodanobacter thiooxydans TaxID=416169 RepID=A0A154QNE3_9GAMM|nr:sulfite reductase flavoprotein subunit alpha [Rhodanobacter thiooxydans]EIM00515.1 flavodoxin/nitric oxide synthase [Rhodanobacter thiooxydans LCS2]KZC25286.1 sulfite reductase subunit alpha [Rhodanobacter thiooxydans]MCW0203562.1 sulfite reductase flavoprotein subunit alpha [Rhodanobacter thiooxydans]